MRRPLFMIVFISLSALLLVWRWQGVQAESAWSVWVYAPERGELVRVDANGDTVAALTLPPNPVQLTIAADGALAAIQADSATIIVYDLIADRQLARIERTPLAVPHTAEDVLYLDQVAFSEGRRALVYGEQIAGLGWRLHWYDLDAGQVTHMLAYGDEALPDLPALHGSLQPRIHSIRGDTVTFSADAVGAAPRRSFHWFATADSLVETVAAPAWHSATLPATGEIVTVLHDRRFAATNELFRYAFQQHNSLHVYANGRGRSPFFNDADLILERVWFIEGGRRVLVEATSDALRRRWLVIGRDGALVRQLTAAGREIVGTPEGFVYHTAVDEQTALVRVNTRTGNDAGRTLWIERGEWRVVWGGAPASNEPLPDWSTLYQAQRDPRNSVEATLTPAPEPLRFRRIGMAIQIYVPEGGYLNMRAQPAINARVITLLESGTRGVIISGPQQADGYLWWHVRVDGREGWVVEALPDALALIPPQDLPTPTPTLTVTPDGA